MPIMRIAMIQKNYPCADWNPTPGRPHLRLRPHHAPALFVGTSQSNRPKVMTLADAAAFVFFPEKLAANLGRPVKPEDQWLPVAIPDSLALAYAGGRDKDYGRAYLRNELATLCDVLDQRLDDPIKIIDLGPARLINVLGCAGYQVNYVSREICPGRVFSNGSFIQHRDRLVELFRPLSKPYWLLWLMEDLGICASSGQRMLFATPDVNRLHDHWLVDTAFALLCNDARFLWLRKEGLPRALEIPRKLLNIALRAQIDTRTWHLSNDTLNRVWRHEAVFNRVARETPQLLKLLSACIREQAIPLTGDAVAEMKQYFLQHGISEAAWRYVHRHGDRLFRVVWEMALNPNKLVSAFHYLKALEQAGLPPAPSSSFVHVWLGCFTVPGTHGIEFEPDWNWVAPSVMRTLLIEAHEQCHERHYPRFLEDVANVINWAVETGWQPEPQHQRDLTWRALRRRCQQWQQQCQKAAFVVNKSWHSLIGPYKSGALQIIPLTTGPALVKEAFVMRNCLDRHVGKAYAGSARFFSLRSLQTGKHQAIVGLKLDEVDQAWHLIDVLGKANSPQPPEMLELGESLARRYTELHLMSLPPRRMRFPQRPYLEELKRVLQEHKFTSSFYYGHARADVLDLLLQTMPSGGVNAMILEEGISEDDQHKYGIQGVTFWDEGGPRGEITIHDRKWGYAGQLAKVVAWKCKPAPRVLFLTGDAVEVERHPDYAWEERGDVLIAVQKVSDPAVWEKVQRWNQKHYDDHAQWRENLRKEYEQRHAGNS